METLILKTLSSEDSWPSHASGEGTAEVFLVPPHSQWLEVVGSTKKELLLPY